ncbi:MAG TPA: hypothetical protein DEB74_17880, partial [Lachnospiraceae bacterium]|nr:hypothetical protein [Lachnospiraceae bacterium]
MYLEDAEKAKKRTANHSPFLCLLRLLPFLFCVLSETRIPCFIRLQKFPKSHFHLYFLPSF